MEGIMEGIVIRMVHDKNFGFIRTGGGHEYFFHRDDFTGHWQDLSQDHASGKIEIKVSFNISETSHRGPRAEKVKRLDFPNRGD